MADTTIFCCKKCGSMDLYTEEKGTQTGLYCTDCGTWVKWLGKEELRMFARLCAERLEVVKNKNLIKAIRTHFKVNEQEKGLENILNELVNADSQILFVTSDYYGNGEVGYTIIYKTMEGTNNVK